MFERKFACQILLITVLLSIYIYISIFYSLLHPILRNYPSKHPVLFFLFYYPINFPPTILIHADKTTGEGNRGESCNYPSLFE